MHKRWISHVVASWIVWGGAGAAHAWSDEPLCALRDPVEIDAPNCSDLDVHSEPQSPPTIGAWVEPISPVQARFALDEAERALVDGRPQDALLQLRVVEHAMPLIADRLALRRADVLARLGMQREACGAYELASESDNRDVAVRGRVATVRCLLDAGDRSAEERLTALLRRYPQVSERRVLRLKLAEAKEGWGERLGAVAIFRGIDLHDPASPEAAAARTGLERLRAAGVRVGEYSPRERVERAERLFRNAPTEVVEVELASLRGDTRLTGELRGRVHLLGARVARDEGSWDAVRDEVEQARRLGVSSADAARVLPPAAPTPSGDVEARAEREVERRIEGIVRGRPLRKLSNLHLRSLLDVAVRHRRAALAGEVLDVMRDRDSFIPSARFEAAIVATGIAPDESLAGLLATVVESKHLRIAGGYHFARALERTGRLGEAEALYLRVMNADKSATRYYAMWAEQRLWALQSQHEATCAPSEASAISSEQPPVQASVGLVDALLQRQEPVALDELFELGGDEDTQSTADPSIDMAPSDVIEASSSMADAAPDRTLLLAKLAELVSAHGEGYPWLRRARDLVELGLFEQAADEVSETLLAWRDAKGSPRLRAGLEAVFTGNAPPRHPTDSSLRRARLALDVDARAKLVEVATMLGDPGTALGFGRRRHDERPRAYSDAVERAARKHGLDPNLLFAVMRVESIFNRRIVSYAGAVGLMQIMPRTGMRIAQKLGVDTFEVTDLLDPELNVEFSAWYLASLLERFDGSLPLAIASYNGGPHNVRLWMRENGSDMPLDAFLERIPFEQTHRYVRRVLTHYAAYRAQQDLPMARLGMELPRQQPDKMAF